MLATIVSAALQGIEAATLGDLLQHAMEQLSLSARVRVWLMSGRPNRTVEMRALAQVGSD